MYLDQRNHSIFPWSCDDEGKKEAPTKDANGKNVEQRVAAATSHSMQY